MAEPASRPSRFNLDVALSFEADDSIVNGQCVNVSESGLLATFKGYVELWSVGQLSMIVGEYHLSIKARVARSHGRDTGLSFLTTTENDRLTVRMLVDFAAAGMKPGDKVKSDI